MVPGDMTSADCYATMAEMETTRMPALTPAGAKWKARQAAKRAKDKARSKPEPKATPGPKAKPEPKPKATAPPVTTPKTLQETLDAILECGAGLKPAGSDDILEGVTKLLARARRMVEQGGEIRLTPWQRFSQEKSRGGLSFAEIGKLWKTSPDNPKNGS